MHFSRFIRPGAHRIGFKNSDGTLLTTAAQNTDGSIIVVLLNQGNSKKTYELVLGDETMKIEMQAQALQTVVIPAEN